MRSDEARRGRARARPVSFTAVFTALLLAAPGGRASPVIDRILAVVSNTIITLSDVNAAMGLGLVDTAGAADRVGSALEQLVERALMLAEVDRYAPPDPSEAAVEARVQVLRSRFGSEEELRRALAAYGLDEGRLRAIARDELRLQTYLDQRFASVTEPSREDVVRYYRDHQRDFTQEGVARPLGEVEAEVRRRLEGARRRALIDEWVRALRQRADVIIVPR